MRTFVFIFVCVLLMWGFFSCLTSNRRVAYDRNATDTTVTMNAEAKNGLDLEAVIPLVKNAKNAQELEQKLNEPGGVNNLDLNEDDKVDFIKVDEYGDRDSWGFSLTTEPAPGEVQEIATIDIARQGENANIQVMGSPNIYGAGTGYFATSLITNMVIMSWLMDFDRPRYRSSWGYGRYPGYYNRYSPVTYATYNSRTSSYKSRASASRISSPRITTPGNPNAGKTASSGIKKSLARPTQAQRSFQARNPSKAVRSGGFGRGSSRSSSSARSSSSSRGFGGSGK